MSGRLNKTAYADRRRTAESIIEHRAILYAAVVGRMPPEKDDCLDERIDFGRTIFEIPAPNFRGSGIQRKKEHVLCRLFGYDH